VAEADPDLVDLTDLDLERLVDLVAEAPERLGMDGELETVVAVTDDYAGTHYGGVVLGAQDVPPHLEVGLTNEFMERASLTTDLTGGRVLHERPLEREESGG
jgi:hypothetical protein